VQAKLNPASLGWGSKRVAFELGCSRNTVKRYLRQGGWPLLTFSPFTRGHAHEW